MSVAIVLCTAPAEEARSLADQLLEARLAACVNLMAPGESRYRWEGAIETAVESLMIIKTSDDRVAELRERLESWHSYDVPEILEVRADSGNPSYAAWVRAMTR